MDIKPSYSCLFRLNYITHSHNSDFKCSCLHKSAHPSTSLDPQQIRKMLLFYLTYTGIQRLVKIAALEKPFTINPNYTREYKETANWDAWAFLCINLSLWQVKSVNPCRHDAFMGQRFSKYDSQADLSQRHSSESISVRLWTQQTSCSLCSLLNLRTMIYVLPLSVLARLG